MTKLIPLVALVSLLSGCVTSNDHYSQTAARSATVPHQTQTAIRSSKLQEKAGSPVMLGAAY